MCRWHTANTEECANPEFENIDADGFRVPYCKTCSRSPPINELIPKLQDEWPRNPPPEDEEIGKMDLYWPDSVFGKKNVAMRSSESPSHIKRTVQVEVDGRNESFDFVDEKPLDSSQVRLMSLSPTVGEDPVCVSLQCYQDDNIPEYEAVSYSLGGENRKRTPTKPIYCGKLRDIMVMTDTCVSMLRFLSPQADGRSGLLWFDYLCINQYDTAERDCQIPKMVSIYGLCTRVIVYLGEDIVQRLGPGEHRSRHWLHEIDETLKSTGKPSPLTLEHILKRDYFKRTWIIQEILLAETVIIPIERCDFRAGLVAINRLSNARRLDWENTGVPWLQHMGQTTIYSHNLYEALRQTWGSNVTDPRDKIFGILGLVQDDPEFKPNSSLSRLSTFIGTCAHLIKRGHTELLFRSMGDEAPAGQLTWLPEWTDPNIWKPQERWATRLLHYVRKRYRIIKSNLNERYIPPSGRMDVICMHPEDKRGDSPDLPLVPRLEHLSVCRSSGALCLNLGHLLTLNSIPSQIVDAGTLKAFQVRMEGTDSCLFISTVNGPLDTLQLSDEIFIHVGAYNELGILFALRFKSQNDCHRLLFSCVCIDVLLFTEGRSLRGIYRSGIRLTKGQSLSDIRQLRLGFGCFRSTFERNLTSILRECHETFRAADPLADKDAFRELHACAYMYIPNRVDPILLKFYIGEDEIILMSQALLDDDAERNARKKTHYLTAYQKVLQDMHPRYTITVDGDDLVLRGFTSECLISVEKDGRLVLHDIPGFRLEEVKKSKWNVPKVYSWRPEELKVSLSSTELAIRRHSIAYHKLNSLSAFRGKKGLNETQILEQCDQQTSENDSVYADNVWPCVKSVVNGLGLSGEVKKVRIQ